MYDNDPEGNTDAMETNDLNVRPLMAEAAKLITGAVEGVDPGRMAAPTPCPEYDVRGLLNHLVYWSGIRAECAARKSPIPDGPEEGHDFTAEPQWRERFLAQVGAAAEAWNDPDAWTGKSGLSGTPAMPAEFIGRMVFGEWLLHGWDLCVATGRRFDPPAELARAACASIAGMAGTAREYGAFGPEVKVPADAPVFDRALGLAGRDPAWRP